MKKLSFALAVVALATSITLTSCSKKKDWTCACTFNGAAAGSTIYPDMKEDDAEDACNLVESTAVANGLTGTSCTLSENE